MSSRAWAEASATSRIAAAIATPAMSFLLMTFWLFPPGGRPEGNRFAPPLTTIDGPIFQGLNFVF